MDSRNEALRVQELDYAITEKYILPPVHKVSLIKYSENYTYLIEDMNSELKYVLRVSRPGYHDYEELEAEMIWVKAVKNDTDILVAMPIEGKNQRLIQSITLKMQGKEQEFFCSMFSFLPGQTLKTISQEELKNYLREIGKITAKLHCQSIEFCKRQKLKRFSWELEDLIGEVSRWGDWSRLMLINEEQRHVFEKTVDIIKERLTVYGKNETNYGLIHTDLNVHNILVESGRIGVIDFDDCGYGWFLWDLGTTLLEYYETLDVLKEKWLEGYQSIRPLRERDLEEVDTFIILRKIVRLGWIASHAENDTVKGIPAVYYEQTKILAEIYLEKMNKGR